MGANKEQQDLFVDQNNVQLINKTSSTETLDKPKNKDKCDMTPFVLMIALAMHALFEGIALGLMMDWQPLTNLMIAIIIHKAAESMSLALSLLRSFKDQKTLLGLLVLFSCATPLGTTLGILLDNAPKIVDIIFTSLAAGTFIYVACSELIVEEFALPGKRWIKFLFFLLGAAIITSLWFFDSG